MRDRTRVLWTAAYGPAIYRSIEDVRAAIGGAGGSIVEFGGLADSLPLPFPLRHPKVLGHPMLIVGTKRD
ncbi:MAG: hypothetical protein AUI10_13400 [Actinobacteria bacterium 13_2_20CM_2_72_6]|nr:MAG: hypothetical protein AUI10_13400 [Actinobacteria bacterium 13_2_20CM_2_72_6]